MKKILSIVTSLLILLPTLTLTASALTDSSSSTTSSDSTSQSSESETETETDKKARLARLEEMKKKYSQAALTEALKKRVSGRCVAAQATLKAHRLAKTPIMDKYSEAYDKIISKLEETAAKLKDEGKDTAALDADITAAKTKVATFKTAIDAFKQDLKDLDLLDCVTDPAGFKAELEAARADQQAVVTAAKDVHTYLRETVKPALNALKDKEDETTN